MSDKEPTNEDVSMALWNVASRSLDGQPAGTSVIVEGCLGMKKMSYWWNFRVWGFRGIPGIIRQMWRDAVAKIQRRRTP